MTHGGGLTLCRRCAAPCGKAGPGAVPDSGPLCVQDSGLASALGDDQAELTLLAPTDTGLAIEQLVDVEGVCACALDVIWAPFLLGLSWSRAMVPSCLIENLLSL